MIKRKADEPNNEVTKWPALCESVFPELFITSHREEMNERIFLKATETGKSF
jgi:hypothetical protein